MAESPGDDPALVEAMRAGDAAAFDTIVQTHGPRMLATVRRILSNEDEAREAVQEAFISAYRARQQFNGESKLATWLHRIAVNAALTILRRRKRHPEESIDDLLPRFLPDGHHRERFQTWDEPVDEALARRETAARVRATIDKLPESYRTVLVLRDIEGLTTEETAAMLGVSENAAKLRLHRARMALRTLLAPTFEGRVE